MGKINKPGEKAITSGQYGVVNKDGKRTGKEVTVTSGEPFPPTPEKDMGFVLNDKTKHQKKSK